MTPKAHSIKRKTDPLDFVEIKNFCSAEDCCKRMKRQATEREKILASRIYKDTSNLYSKEKNPTKTWASDMKRQLMKEDIQMANKHMQRCSTLVAPRETQIKTTVKQATQNG